MVAFSTVAGECRHPLGESIVIRHNASGISIGTQIFAWVKRECSGISKGSNVLPLVAGQVGLGAILYDPKIVPLCDGHDCIHIRRLSVKMDWNNADRSRCDLSLDIGGVDRESFLICVAEYNLPVGLCDCLGRGNPGMCRGDDFVAGLYTKSPEGNVNRVRPVCAGDTMLHTKSSCPCLLKSIHMSPANVSRLCNDLGNRAVDLLFDRQVLRVQVNEGDSH